MCPFYEWKHCRACGRYIARSRREEGSDDDKVHPRIALDSPFCYQQGCEEEFRMVTKGLLVELEAKAGKEHEVEAFLKAGARRIFPDGWLRC